jgi:hypothetical protein
VSSRATVEGRAGHREADDVLGPFDYDRNLGPGVYGELKLVPVRTCVWYWNLGDSDAGETWPIGTLRGGRRRLRLFRGRSERSFVMGDHMPGEWHQLKRRRECNHPRDDPTTSPK